VFTFNHLRRRVSIEHSHGSLHVRIAGKNQRVGYIFVLAWFSCGALSLIWMFTRAVWRSAFAADDWPFLMIVAVIAGVYLIFVRRLIWRAFGVDEIVIQGGRLQWTSRALWLKQELELPASEISGVKPVTPWHAMRNHVEFTCGSRRYLVGDGLLQEETVELAQAMKHAVGIR
jgi:hypothetical protein